MTQFACLASIADGKPRLSYDEKLTKVLSELQFEDTLNDHAVEKRELQSLIEKWLHVVAESDDVIGIVQHEEHHIGTGDAREDSDKPQTETTLEFVARLEQVIDDESDDEIELDDDVTRLLSLAILFLAHFIWNCSSLLLGSLSLATAFFAIISPSLVFGAASQPCYVLGFV